MFFSLFFWANSINGQISLEDSILSNTQGGKQGDITFYEVEGYDVFVQTLTQTPKETIAAKIKSKYSISKGVVGISDSSFKENNILLIDSVKLKNGFMKINIFHVFPNENNQAIVIGFRIINERDILLENIFTKAILSNSIPQDVYIKLPIDSIKFAGRMIFMGADCRWGSMHNIQCIGFGQINWVECRSLEKAEKIIKWQHDYSEAQPIDKILEEKIVDILFEGKETKALKTKYKLKIPKFFTRSRSNILIVYYVAQEIRGKYIGAVLSHYDNDAEPGDIPDLLKQVMQLKN